MLFTIDARGYQAEYDRARGWRAPDQAALARAANPSARAAWPSNRPSPRGDRRATPRCRRAGRCRGAGGAGRGELTRLNLEFTRVRAPIDGRAGRLVTAGNLVTAGDSASVLTTLVSSNGWTPP